MVRINDWDWTVEGVTEHRGRTVGALAQRPGQDAPQLVEHWDTLLGDGTASSFEVWATCGCGWEGIKFSTGSNEVKRLGRAGVEAELLLRGDWDQHVTSAMAPKPVEADLKKVADLLAEIGSRTPADALYVLRCMGSMLQGQLADSVAAARLDGRSWSEIAEPLGVSKAAAYEKYRAIDPTRWDGKAERCEAAHRQDYTLCEGNPEAVEIVLESGDSVRACVSHGARFYASTTRPRVRPVGGPDGPNAGAALEVYHRAQGMTPFFWMSATDQLAEVSR